MKNKLRNIIILVIIAGSAYSIYIYQINEERERIERVIQMSSKYQSISTLISQGKYEDALEIYNFYINKYPEQEWLLLWRGVLFEDLQLYSQALKDYLNIKHANWLTIDKRQKDLRIGGIYEKIGQIDSAIYYYDMIIKTKTTNLEGLDYDLTKAGAFGRLAKIYFDKGDFKKSLSYYNQSLNIEASHSKQYLRANVYYKLGMLDSAHIDYHQSIPMIRKLYIYEHPKYKDILCDTCGEHFDTFEYTDVLEEWMTFEEKIMQRNINDSILKSRDEYKIMIDSISIWNIELEELKKQKINDGNIKRINALVDSINKYTDTIIKFNIKE